jgi:hypothetical protein
MPFKRKYANYFRAGMSGEFPWRRSGIEEWLTALQVAHAESGVILLLLPHDWQRKILQILFHIRRNG